MSDPVLIGIDVARHALEIALGNQQAVRTIVSDAAGIEQLKAIGPALVALKCQRRFNP